MGGTIRCEKCHKGISKNEKEVYIEDQGFYHYKCYQRIEKSKK